MFSREVENLGRAARAAAAWLGRPLAWRLVVAALLGAVAIAWVMHEASARTDQVRREQEEHLVANALKVRERQIRRSLMSAVLWDEAVLNLDLSFDRDWAERNIVQYQAPASHLDLIYVLDAHGGPMLAHAQQGDPMSAFSQIRRPVADLVSAVRKAEKARGPIRPRSGQGLVSRPIDASTVALINGQPFIVAAALIQPDFGSVLPHAKAPIAIVAQAVDGRFLSELSAEYLLSPIRVAPLDAAAPRRGEAVADLRDMRGRTVAHLTWTPGTPGGDVVRYLREPMIILLLLLIAGPATLVWRERRHNDELSAAIRRAEAASQSKSDFLANVSHEIRTPLNGVMGMVQVLQRGELLPAQEEPLRVIVSSGRMLTAVLNDVLDLSKIEAGQLTLDAHDFDVEQVIDTACRPFESLAAEKEIGFRIEIDAAARGVWRGDGGRLRQIVSNLVSNAVKFTLDGAVAIQVRRCEHGLTVRVADTGIGIPPARLPDLFAKFTQADASTTRRFGGTGLGLAISRELALLMGGDLTADSVEGQGSTFLLTVPFERRSAPAAPAASMTPPPAANDHQRSLAAAPPGPASPAGAQPEPATAPVRILAAEDNPTNQLILKAFLDPLGVELTLAADGRAAVEAFRAGRFDVVLMDVQMPILDGVAAAREIRRLEAAEGRPRTPILALSANVMSHQIREYEAAGMDGSIAKPIQFERMVAQIERALAGPGDAEPAAATGA